ncbi:hypothetical protein PS906_02997 [Pseudomonas fluorescens]|nr:hypothetical protein PS906_02997 [Pseudomonas fluorescens]
MWQGTPSHHCAKSFTLIELLLTLALQATFSTVAYLLTALMDKRNRGLDLQRWLREIRRAVDACKEASHDSRLEKTVSGSVHPPSLQVLIERGTSQHLRLHTKARQAVLRDHSSSIRQTLRPYRAPPLSANPSGAPLPASGLCSPTGRHGQLGWRAPCHSRQSTLSHQLQLYRARLLSRVDVSVWPWAEQLCNLHHSHGRSANP